MKRGEILDSGTGKVREGEGDVGVLGVGGICVKFIKFFENKDFIN